MTRTSRVLDVIYGLLMLLTGYILIMIKVKYGIVLMLFLMQFGMTIRGLQKLFYYLTMARFMVGGRTVLYRSIILLDLGVLGVSLVGHEVVYAAVYLALIHSFEGIVSILRANEARINGAHWRLKMVYGMTGILIAGAVVIGYAVLNEPGITTFIYGCGLMYAAVLRIASAFRRTKVVYIQ